ncbi:hypothetical protein P5G51_016585 [Virgibacillus sp. 179-BFC.A HS]|uniref:Uncharacterized protein n=1 Tax=Tigheibacillus jepli TaxID=3035914 RepID=A0ABU5CK79_9BACI|nr:hypothetical protein [Virgibacillus sp. 179-BFC.A HS]MDY0406759.1 hypothetical protein [Virgibacillus sp. 179-BFC.A HS]
MKQSDLAMYAMMYFVYAMFAVVLAYFAARFLHQYAFMKANMRFVRYHKPNRKVIKQAEAKGKKFIIK